ncbi:MAG: tetratricopeptide repeat protein [Firmicutes bacterium]|nr:tetratricopeptide repeat protein [Bacillota bacterium]
MKPLRTVLATALVLFAGLALGSTGFGRADTVALRLAVGLRYMAHGWIAEAREHLEQAVRLSPALAEGHVLLGLSYHAEGELERAVGHYRMAQAADPSLSGLQVLVGDIRMSQGRLAEAEAEYRSALAAEPDLGWAYYGVGRVLQARGEPGALEMYEAAVERAPDLVDARFRLALLLRDTGDLEAALEHLLHATQVNGYVPEIRLQLAMIYESLGRAAEAEHEYRTVLELDPGRLEAREGLCRLREEFC